MKPFLDRPPLDQQITFLHTDDLDKTAVFYEDILGLRLVLDQGVCRIYKVNENAYIGFCESLGAHMDVRESGGLMLTLVTKAVDEWYQQLVSLDVAVEKPPTLNQKFNIYQCFVRDPNGYLIEIQQFMDDSWLNEA